MTRHGMSCLECYIRDRKRATQAAEDIWRHTARYRAVIMGAYGGGLDVQAMPVSEESDWEDCPYPTWNWADFEYRLK